MPQSSGVKWKEEETQGESLDRRSVGRDKLGDKGLWTSFNSPLIVSIQFNSIKFYSDYVSQPVAELHMVTVKIVINYIEHNY